MFGRGAYDPETHGPQPFFMAPRIVLIMIGALVAAFAVVAFLPPETQLRAVLAGSLIAARYASHFGMDAPAFEAFQFEDSAASLLSPFVSHVFFHASPAHLGFNCIWLLIFGTTVARRLGANRPLFSIDGFYGASLFLSFFLLGGVAAGLVFVLMNLDVMIPLIGASGAIAALMGGSARFVFRRPLTGDIYSAPLAPLRDRSVIGFSFAWVLINAMFAVFSTAFVPEGVSIAWEAHLGGYFFGLLVFPLFDGAGRIGRSAPPSKPF